MRGISKWSARRVIVACALWLLGAPVLGALGLVLGGLVLAAISGGQHIAFSISLSNWSLGWLFFPPIVLVAVWVWTRRSTDP